MGYKQYCKEPEKIENYEKAKKDGFVGWQVHHRLETHTPDGIRREVDIGYKELKALRMYYHRPPEELIFLTIKEHNAFKKGKHHSEETKNKMREVKKGEKNPFYGKHHSDETRKKLSEANIGENNPMYGKHHSEETKKKMSEKAKGNTKTKGMRWFNNGKINTMAKECPDGFIPGMLR